MVAGSQRPDDVTVKTKRRIKRLAQGRKEAELISVTNVFKSEEGMEVTGTPWVLPVRTSDASMI